MIIVKKETRRGRVSPRSKDKLFFKLFLLFSFSKDGGEIRRYAREVKKLKKFFTEILFLCYDYVRR